MNDSNKLVYSISYMKCEGIFFDYVNIIFYVIFCFILELYKRSYKGFLFSVVVFDFRCILGLSGSFVKY